MEFWRNFGRGAFWRKIQLFVSCIAMECTVFGVQSVFADQFCDTRSDRKSAMEALHYAGSFDIERSIELYIHSKNWNILSSSCDWIRLDWNISCDRNRTSDLSFSYESALFCEKYSDRNRSRNGVSLGVKYDFFRCSFV